MLKSIIVAIVTRCTHYAWTVIAVTTIISAVAGVYAAKHFGINTDINTLISPDLPGGKREIAFERAFPQHLQSILVVVDAPTPELASQATAALVDRLSANKEAFKSIAQPGGGEFFRRNGLLFLPVGGDREGRRPARRRPSRWSRSLRPIRACAAWSKCCRWG